MAIRYELFKGYRSYDYDYKGSVFKQGKSPEPLARADMFNKNTSHTYMRRVRTDELPSFKVTDLVSKEQQKVFKTQETSRFTVTFETIQPLLYAFQNKPFSYTFELKTKQQYRGLRLFFICQHCKTCCERLYFYEYVLSIYMACRECLGLTYASRAGHKTIEYDNKLLGLEGRGVVALGQCEAPKVSLESIQKASERRAKRLGRFTNYLSTKYGLKGGKA